MSGHTSEASEKNRIKSTTELWNLSRKNMSREEEEWYKENWDIDFPRKSENKFSDLSSANPFGVGILYMGANIAMNIFHMPLAPPFFDMTGLVTVAFAILSKALFFIGLGICVAAGGLFAYNVVKDNVKKVGPKVGS